MPIGRRQIDRGRVAHNGVPKAFRSSPESPLVLLWRQIHQARTFWFLAGAAGVIVCLLLWARLPLAALRASWNDERLFVQPAVVSLENMRAKQTSLAEFKVKNLTDTTLTLRWMNPGSSMFKVQLPLEIAPGETKAVEVAVTPRQPGKYRQYIVFYTSDEIKPVFFVRFAGQVLPPQS